MVSILSTAFIFHDRTYRHSTRIQNCGGNLTRPETVSFGSGIFSFSAILKLKFCMRAVAIKKITFLAKVSPAHKRLPAPNGNVLSNFTENFPFSSKNRSGLNSCGCFHMAGSSLHAVSEANTIEPCREKKTRIQIQFALTVKSIFQSNCLWNIVAHKFGIMKCCVR